MKFLFSSTIILSIIFIPMCICHQTISISSHNRFDFSSSSITQPLRRRYRRGTLSQLSSPVYINADQQQSYPISPNQYHQSEYVLPQRQPSFAFGVESLNDGFLSYIDLMTQRSNGNEIQQVNE